MNVDFVSRAHRRLDEGDAMIAQFSKLLLWTLWRVARLHGKGLMQLSVCMVRG